MRMPGAPSSTQKTIEIVAGPNGSGKTTFAEMLFRVRPSISTFVNPDIIAAGIAPANPDNASFAAGRILVNEIQTLLKQEKSFAFESTLSGRSWIRALKDAKASGYKIRIYFIALKNMGLNLQRIKTRVKNGGHNIPPSIVRRRHPRVFKLVHIFPANSLNGSFTIILANGALWAGGATQLTR